MSPVTASTGQIYRSHEYRYSCWIYYKSMGSFLRLLCKTNKVHSWIATTCKLAPS